MKSPRCSRVLRTLATAACIACPLLAYAAGGRAQPGLPAVALTWGPLALLGAWWIWRSRLRAWLGLLAALLLLGLWQERALWLGHLGVAYLLEHAGSLSLLGLMFGGTLRRGQVPLVTRFAAGAHPAMSASLRAYTRGVTVAWTGFFGAMACTSALVFALRPLRDWALFASVWTPALVVLMFVAEYAARMVLVAPAERSGPWEAVRAYLRYAAARDGAGEARQ